MLTARKVARGPDQGCASKAKATPYFSELDKPRSCFGALPAHLLPPPTPMDSAEGQGMESPEGAQPGTPGPLQKPKRERSAPSSPPGKTTGKWRSGSRLCGWFSSPCLGPCCTRLPHPPWCIWDDFFESLFIGGLPQPSGRTRVRLQSSLYFKIFILCLR